MPWTADGSVHHNSKRICKHAHEEQSIGTFELLCTTISASHQPPTLLQNLLLHQMLHKLGHVPMHSCSNLCPVITEERMEVKHQRITIQKLWEVNCIALNADLCTATKVITLHSLILLKSESFCEVMINGHITRLQTLPSDVNHIGLGQSHAFENMELVTLEFLLVKLPEDLEINLLKR